MFSQKPSDCYNHCCESGAFYERGSCDEVV